MKVRIGTINTNQPTQYYILKDAEDGRVLYAAPNNWKTERGAIRWAEKNGFEVAKEARA
jgi:hypothetical protein